MDGGAWWTTVHGAAKSQTLLSDFTFTVYPEVELLEPIVVLCLILGGTLILFSTAATSFHLFTSTMLILYKKFFCQMACENLVLQSGTEPTRLAVDVWS